MKRKLEREKEKFRMEDLETQGEKRNAEAHKRSCERDRVSGIRERNMKRERAGVTE